MSPIYSLKLLLIVDSKYMYDKVSTLKNERDYCLQQMTQRVRDIFEKSDMKNLCLLKGKANISNGITKGNP